MPMPIIFFSFGIIEFILSYFENRDLHKPLLGGVASVAYFVTGHEPSGHMA